MRTGSLQKEGFKKSKKIGDVINGCSPLAQRLLAGRAAEEEEDTSGKVRSMGEWGQLLQRL